MISKLLPVVLCLLAGSAHADVVWGPTNRDSGTSVLGVGDPLAPEGAHLRLAAEAIGPQGFAGAIAALDATALRGREVELTAVLEVTDGKGPGAIWLRADGPSGSLAFLNTSTLPVRSMEGPQARSLRLYIPMAATSVKLGTTLKSIGAIEATSIRLKVFEPLTDGVSAYDVLQAAIADMQAHALFASRVDWSFQSTRLLTPEMKSAPAAESYSRINELLKALGDRHSFLLPRTAVGTDRASTAPLQAVKSEVTNGIGHLLVPGFHGTNAATARQLSTDLCNALSAGAATASQGWIIDLRENPGGNMWPMIAGLRPLLGDATIGSTKDRDDRVEPWPSESIEACNSQLAAIPVAVLIGPATASSGEAVAVAFRGRANTRFFGHATAGVATSNRGFPLPDASVLMLTTAVFLDRIGRAYPEGIVPDVSVDANENAVATAELWLRSQGG